MAQNSSYSPTPFDLKKYNMLKNIRNDKNIILLKPDVESGIVIFDRQVYKDSCLKIINNQTKFKYVTKDPTLYREAKFQCFLRKLKNQGSLDESTFQNIYPKGSQPARFYGLPKFNKHQEPNEAPSLRPIVSFINASNYKLPKYLCALLSPLIPAEYILFL